MENFLFLLASTFVLPFTSSKKLKNRFIGSTGCSALFIAAKKFKKTKTDAGDDLYFSEFSEKNVTYGIVCIEMKEQFELIEAKEMLAGYMNKLRGPFFIFHSVGHEKGNDWNNPDSCSLIDYWQDAVGIDCKIKGYTNGKVLAILYVKNINDAVVTKQEMFLDSFHFNAN